MKVIHIIDKKPTISEVPHNWEKCVVLHQYFPPEDFIENSRISRKVTELGLSDMTELEFYMEEMESIERGEEFLKLRKDLLKNAELEDVSMTVSEMINHLEKLDPNAKLLICKQNGTNVESEWSIHKPMKYESSMGIDYYSIGLTTNFQDHPVVVDRNKSYSEIAEEFYNGLVESW